MKRCKYCGAALEGDYCSVCDRRQPREKMKEMKGTCDQCGKEGVVEIVGHKRVCPECDFLRGAE